MTGPSAGVEIASGTLMQGKRGLIMGVANNRSLAWGIAKATAAQGAMLAFTYQGDALKKRVEPLAQELGSRLILPCDVTDTASMDAVFAQLQREWGKLDFLVHAIAFSDKAELDGRYVDTTEKNFTQTMLISCYSFTALAKRAEKLMGPGGALLTLTYYGAEKVMPHYNVMGVAKAALEASVRYLAADLGKDGIRVNAISAGSDQDAGRLRHLRFPLHPALERVQLRAQAHGNHRGGGLGGRLPSFRPLARRHRRGASRGRRLPRAGHEERGRPRHLGGEGPGLSGVRYPLPCVRSRCFPQGGHPLHGGITGLYGPPRQAVSDARGRQRTKRCAPNSVAWALFFVMYFLYLARHRRHDIAGVAD